MMETSREIISPNRTNKSSLVNPQDCPREIFRISGNLLGIRDGFPNTSLVLMEDGPNHQNTQNMFALEDCLPLLEDCLPLLEDCLPLLEDCLPLLEDCLPLLEDCPPLFRRSASQSNRGLRFTFNAGCLRKGVSRQSARNLSVAPGGKPSCSRQTNCRPYSQRREALCLEKLW